MRNEVAEHLWAAWGGRLFRVCCCYSRLHICTRLPSAGATAIGPHTQTSPVQASPTLGTRRRRRFMQRGAQRHVMASQCISRPSMPHAYRIQAGDDWGNVSLDLVCERAGSAESCRMAGFAHSDRVRCFDYLYVATCGSGFAACWHCTGQWSPRHNCERE